MLRKMTFTVFAALSAAAVLSLTGLAAEGDDSTAAAVSPETNEYYGLLTAISDIEEFIAYDEEPVTRADFVQAFISAIGAEERSGADLSFTDVDASSDMYGAISAAVGMSLISDSESFRPDDNITINEIYKICVTACGYGLRAEMTGGYPEGYIAAAADLRLSDGTSGGGSVTGADAYRIIYNTLDADYYEWSSSGYTKGEGNVLKAYRGIEAAEGTVTSNSTAATGSYEDAAMEPEMLEGTIGIDYIRYKTQTDYDKYLGYSVRAYISEGEYDSLEVVYVYPKNTNEEIELASHDMEYSNGYVEDTDRSSSKRYAVNSSAEIIYNGRADYNYRLDQLNDITGTVRLIDNNGDGRYDYVIVDSYYYMSVASFDRAELIIRDSTDSEKQLELDNGVKYSVYSEEEAAYTELSEITQDSILAVKRSTDKKIVDIIILGRILSGSVDSYSEEKVTVDGTSYYLSDHFIENYYTGLRSGKSADFYLGINDEIAAFSYIENSMEYGYLMLAYMEDGGLDMGVRLFTQQGEIVRYACPREVVVDGERMSAAKACEAINAKGTRQLIRYGLNTEGQVRYIDTSERSTTYLDDTQPLDEYNNLTRNVFAASYYYRVSVFYPYFNTQNTLIFRVPNTAEDEDAYAIGYSFADGNIADGTVEAYNVGLDGTADAVVVYADNDDSTINRVSPSIILVEDVYEEVAPDGEVKTKITGWENGTFREHYLRDGIEILKNREPAEIKPGDIVRFTENSNEITAAVVEFIGEQLRPNTGDNLGYFNIRSTDCHYQVGSVYSLEGQWALISNTQGETGYDFDTENLINVRIPDNIAVYNLTDKTVRTGTRDDIKTYRNSGGEASYILVKQYYGTSNFCVIYEQ